MTQTIFTIGHSTHPIEKFVAMLQSFDIRTLADIRTIPQSRYNPQFSLNNLAASLAAAQITYVPMKSLGGKRKPLPDSPNTGWRSDGFRGYADYMMTAEFGDALDGLIGLAARSRTAMMCAEALPWKCHRSLVADALTARGTDVVHIMAAGQSRPHEMTDFAKIKGHTLLYPAAPEPQGRLF